MNMKDPLLNSCICISKSHWEVMTDILKKQINGIRYTSGVDFNEDIAYSDVNVTAHSTGKQIVTLEVNALRALISLKRQS